MKSIKLIIIILIFCVFSTGFTLKGSVSYSLEEARVKAFKNTPNKIDINEHKNYFFDPYYSENISAIKKNKLNFRNRSLNYFSGKSYCVNYKKNKSVVYIYTKDGHLKSISFLNRKSHLKTDSTYNIDGVLNSTSLHVSNQEVFMFNSDGELSAHWIGDKCYDENGTLIMTRNKNY